MAIKDKSIDELDAKIPELAIKAWKEAYAQALKGKTPVLAAKDGNLVEIGNDGSCRVIRKLPPHVKVRRGQKINLQ